jgi:hypothetical protein
MTSPLLALFIRSLREDSRLKFTYFSRAALVLLILLFLISTRTAFGWVNAPGLVFFGTVVHIDLCFVVLAGVSYFASAISEEKEEQTLGLLRMTNLNPLSILLGKSTSRLWTAGLLFAAQFPFTLLSITLGGVTLRQILAAYLSIGAFLVLVSNLALFASVMCRRTSSASVLTGLVLLLFFGFAPLSHAAAYLPVWLDWLPATNRWTDSILAVRKVVLEASPFIRVEFLLTRHGLGPLAGFQVWSNLGVAAACFLLAWALFNVFCGEQREAGPGRAGLLRSTGRRSLLAPSRPWRLALAWKDFYFTTGGRLWLGIKWIVYGLPIAYMIFRPVKLGGRPAWEDLGFGTFWFMVVITYLELSFAAATLFRNERQGQTLSSLAMLPRGLRSVAYEKLFGVLPALGAALFYLALSLPLASHELSTILNRASGEDWTTLCYLLCQGVFFLHLVLILSLYLRRGALPLAIGAQVLIVILTGLLASHTGQDERLVITFLTVLTAGVTLILHLCVSSRLATVAAEG